MVGPRSMGLLLPPLPPTPLLCRSRSCSMRIEMKIIEREMELAGGEREREREAESVVELSSWVLVVGTRKLGMVVDW